MSSLRGTRRTRLYDTAYNIGESYYKSAINDLDRKYQTRTTPSILTDRLTPLRTRLEDKIDEDLLSARSRASRAITEESVFDSRGARLPKPVGSSFFEDELDDEINSSMNRSRASKLRTAALIKDLDFDTDYEVIKPRRKFIIDENSNGFNDDSSATSAVASRRRLRFSARDEDASEPIRASSVSQKYSAISSKISSSTSAAEESSSAASLRAKASKARLQDLETDMFDRSEKLLAREKRAANLKQLLVDNDIELIKKQVTF